MPVFKSSRQWFFVLNCRKNVDSSAVLLKLRAHEEEENPDEDIEAGELKHYPVI
jgi:hypothetical protein